MKAVNFVRGFTLFCVIIIPMGLFSKVGKEGELVLVFDIGSSSVGGALFLTQKSGIPKIVKVVREPILLQEALDIDRFLNLAMKSLETVAGEIYKAGMGVPQKCFCVLASPWHVSQTRVIKLAKNAPFVFNEKLANSLIKKEIALFEEEYSAKYGNVRSPVSPIEFKNIKIMLNGYETAKPLDQKARELEMTVFVSICEERILERVRGSLARFFHFKEVKFSSFVLASFAVVRDVYAHNNDFLLVDISGEVTEISMAKKNVLRESVSFPLGSNFIVRKASAMLSAPLEETKSLIALFENRHATEPVATKLMTILESLRKEWLQKFQESLANLSNDLSIPSTIYLAADKDFVSFFKQTIETEQFNQYTLTESKFKVVFLGSDIFHGMVAFDGSPIEDTFLVIDSIFINKLLNHSAPGK